MKITVATKITIARMLMVIPSAAFYIAAQLANELHLPFIIVSATVFALLCASDFLDGLVARKTNTVTDLGKYLDPIADKVVIAVMLFLIVFANDGLSLDGKFAANVVVIAVLSGAIMAREFIIGAVRTIAAKNGMVMSSDILGKLKTAFINTGAIVLLLAGAHVVFGYIGTIIFYIGALLALVSGVHYIAVNRRMFLEKNDGATD